MSEHPPATEEIQSSLPQTFNTSSELRGCTMGNFALVGSLRTNDVHGAHLAVCEIVHFFTKTSGQEQAALRQQWDGGYAEKARQQRAKRGGGLALLAGDDRSYPGSSLETVAS